MGVLKSKLGKLYKLKGKLQLAYKSLVEGLQLWEGIGGGNLWISKSLLDIILLSIDIPNFQHNHEYLEKLQQLSKKTRNEVITTRYRLAEAFLLKNNSRLHKKMEAFEKFRQIIDAEVVDYESHVIAVFSLCDLLLLEIQSTGETAALNEVHELLQDLFDLGQQQKSYSLVIEVLLLRAKTILLEGDAEEARKFLEKARSIAEENEAEFLLQKVLDHQKVLDDEVIKWIDLVDQNVDMSERIKEAKLQEYISLALKTITGAPDPNIEKFLLNE